MGYLRDGSETGRPDVHSRAMCGGREARVGGRTLGALDLVFSQLLEAVDSYEDCGACAVNT